MYRDGPISGKRIGRNDVMTLRTKSQMSFPALPLLTFTANEIEPLSFNVIDVINSQIKIGLKVRDQHSKS